MRKEEIIKILGDIDGFLKKGVTISCPNDQIKLVLHKKFLRCTECAFMVEPFQNNGESNNFPFSEILWRFLKVADDYVNSRTDKNFLSLHLRVWAKGLKEFNYSTGIEVCQRCLLIPDSCPGVCKDKHLIFLQPWEIATYRVGQYWGDLLRGFSGYINEH